MPTAGRTATSGSILLDDTWCYAEQIPPYRRRRRPHNQIASDGHGVYRTHFGRVRAHHGRGAGRHRGRGADHYHGRGTDHCHGRGAWATSPLATDRTCSADGQRNSSTGRDAVGLNRLVAQHSHFVFLPVAGLRRVRRQLLEHQRRYGEYLYAGCARTLGRRYARWSLRRTLPESHLQARRRQP